MHGGMARFSCLQPVFAVLFPCPVFRRHAYQIWPEQMPVGSVVMVSGQDSIVPAQHVRKLLEGSAHVKLQTNERFHHAQFLFRWVRQGDGS